MGRIRTISPTINKAEKKLNGVIGAIKHKYKRMTDFVLQENELRSNVFTDDGDDSIMPHEEGEEGFAAIANINYVHQKLEGVKEIIIEKMFETLQRMFQTFVGEFTHDKNPLFENKLIFYCLLKTEGDIMIELGDHNKAIQAYKALRNYCRAWGLLEQEMWMAEQIGMTYRTIRYYKRAVDYFKY